MRGIENQLQPVAGCDLLECAYIAGISIKMYGKDGAGARRDPALDVFHIDVPGLRIAVRKDGLQPVPARGMRGGKKSEARNDDLAGKTQGSKYEHQAAGATR